MQIWYMIFGDKAGVTTKVISEDVRIIFLLEAIHCVAFHILCAIQKNPALSLSDVCRLSISVKKRLTIIVILVVCYVILRTPTSYEVSLEEAR